MLSRNMSAGRGSRDGPPVIPHMQVFSGGVSKTERALMAGTNGTVAEAEANITEAVKTYGLAPGGRKMMDAEKLAAEEAVATGLYGVWRNSSSGHDFCGRVGPLSRCFCGHDYTEHAWDKARKKLRPACTSCPCSGFLYIPRRPEEVGEYWLPRRRGFDVRIWRAKCKCSHSHEDHDPTRLGCRSCGGCSKYASAWMCTCCDGKWEDHETLFETEDERRMEGRSVGAAFFPLASTPQIQELAFNNSAAAASDGSRSFSLPHRPRPERSVKLMLERSPHYGGSGPSGGLEEAFPARSAAGPRPGGLEDAFPPQRGAGTMGSLEDSFPSQRGAGAVGSLEEAFQPRQGSAGSSGRGVASPFGGSEDAFRARLRSGESAASSRSVGRTGGARPPAGRAGAVAAVSMGAGTSSVVDGRVRRGPRAGAP